MTALFTIFTSDGRRRSCDERCFNASDAHCTCVCGGNNHGVGIRQAAQQTVHNLPAWLQHLAAGPLRGLAPMAVQHHSLHAIAHPQLARLDGRTGWRSYS